jgi:hypothetical protein
MQKQSELAESESKLRDLIVMRREKAELQGERKHMSVKQRVLMDKSNFELELWALDSLPQEVTRDALKAVCRELGLSDISDIQPAIMKLKAVVGAVPRMEKFITKVCSGTLHCTPLHALLSSPLLRYATLSIDLPHLRCALNACFVHHPHFTLTYPALHPMPHVMCHMSCIIYV